MWRIGDSVAAPKFNVVSKPNDWSRSVKQGLGDGSLSELQKIQKKYWEAFHRVLSTANGHVAGGRKPRSENWMSYSVGRSGFSLLVSRNKQRQRLRASMYLSDTNAKSFFALLQRDRDSIEQELGQNFVWREMRKECEIASYLDKVDPNDESDWPRQHEWLASQINEMHRVFAPRIKRLTLDEHDEDEL